VSSKNDSRIVNYRPSYCLWNHPNDATWKGDKDGGQRQCHHETLQPVTLLGSSHLGRQGQCCTVSHSIHSYHTQG
jgi:hypothetical protein